MSRPGHWWRWEGEWMDTVAGRYLGGISCCGHCGMMRFSRPGHPPRHYYVRRVVLDAHVKTTIIRPGHPEVMDRAPICTGPTPTQERLL